jgi:hypothetical protein
MIQLEGKTLYQAKLVADQLLTDLKLVYDKAEGHLKTMLQVSGLYNQCDI